MCLAQGPQHSDASEARTRGPSVSSQALYHWATALPNLGRYIVGYEIVNLVCSDVLASHTMWLTTIYNIIYLPK